MIAPHAPLSRQIAALPQASPPLLLLVGPEERLSPVLHDLQAATQAPCIALSHALGQRLLEATPRERVRTAARTLRALVRAYQQPLLLLDRTALLFLPELYLNPLQVVRDISRSHRPLVMAWAGQWDGVALTYAAPGHPEYQRIVHPEAIIVPIE
jgi:hypothetical protein